MFIKGFILAVTECIDSYQAHIDATSMHPHNNTQKQMERHIHTSQALFIFTIYATNLAVIRLISLADFGSDLRYWMTRGNHIEPRYDRIQGRSLMPCTKTQLDHVLPHNTGSLRIPSLLQLTFPLKDTITQLPASCF